MASRRGKRARRGTAGIAAGVAGTAAVVLAASVAGLVTALAPAAPPVEVAAAVVPAPEAAPWTRSAPAVPGPADPAAGAQSVGPGMVVPQPPRPVRSGLVITPLVGVGESPELTPRPEVCGGHATPRRVAPGVVPGPGGTATVSWQAGGRAEVLGYRVSAVSQTLRPGAQPAPLQQTVAQPADCGPVTLALAGLVPGDTYVFWLEEQTVDAGTSVVRFVQIGSSSPVVIEP